MNLSAHGFLMAVCLATDRNTIDLKQSTSKLRAAAEDARRLGGDSPESRAAHAALAAARHLTPERAHNSPVFKEGEETNWRARAAFFSASLSLLNEGWTDSIEETLLGALEEALASLLLAVDAARSNRNHVQATRLTDSERAAVSVLAQILRRPDNSDGDAGVQLELDGLPTLPAPQVRAYMACALTRCEDTQYRAMTAAQRELAARLEDELGVKSHVPSDYTDPRRNPDIAPGDVHATDFIAVLDSDLLIVNAAEPSFGVGKEIAWAEAAGAIVLIASPMAASTSRLIAGSPAEPREILYSDQRDFEDQVLQFVRENLATLVERAMARERLLFPRTLALLQSGTFDASRGTMTARRFEELTRSSSCLAVATLTEVCTAATMAGLPAADVLDTFAAEHVKSSAINPRLLGPASLTRPQVAALGDAAQINGWTGVQVTELMDRALVSLGKSGHYRRPLTTVEDWEGLKGQ